MNTPQQLRHDESAATTVEYALLLALIAGGLLFSLLAMGNSSGTFWGRTADVVDVIGQ